MRSGPRPWRRRPPSDGTACWSAALDTCYLALAIAPSDPAIHLALAGLYLDRGWRVSAVDKIILLGRLADLTDDEATHDRLAILVAERLERRAAPGRPVRMNVAV